MANHLSYDVLSRLVERRALAVEDARAQRHLASCGRCRSELAWLERIRSLPQRNGELGAAEQPWQGAGDGWGHVRRRPAGSDPTDFQGSSRGSAVAAYWLKVGQSPLAR